jgi:hypothetical protein
MGRQVKKINRAKSLYLMDYGAYVRIIRAQKNIAQRF